MKVDFDPASCVLVVQRDCGHTDRYNHDALYGWASNGRVPPEIYVCAICIADSISDEEFWTAFRNGTRMAPECGSETSAELPPDERYKAYGKVFKVWLSADSSYWRGVFGVSGKKKE